MSEGLVLLGATGSIGASAIDVVRELGDRFRIVGLSCLAKWRELDRLAAETGAEAVAVADHHRVGA